jgi:hypothetical protein
MSNDFGKIIAAESFKLRRQRTSVVILTVVALLAVVMFFVLEFAARRDWIGIPSGHFIAASVINWMTNVMIVLAVIVTSFFVSQEFALGTIKATWVRPVTRSQWYTAKVYTAAVAITELFAIVVIIVVVLAVTRLGFTDLTEKGYVVHTTESLTRRLVLTVALTIWSLWAVAAFIAMLAAVFKHPGGAIAAGLGAGIALMVLAAFPPARPFLLSTYVTMPMEQMVTMTKGLPLPLEWGDLVWRTLAGAGAWMVVAFVVGQRIIRRKEIAT